MLYLILVAILGAIVGLLVWAGRGQGGSAWPEYHKKLLTMLPVLAIWMAFLLMPFRRSIGFSGSVLFTAFSMMPMALCACGAVLLSGARQRRGLDVRCAHCEYPVLGLTLATTPIPCPECGRGLTERAGTTRGVRAWNWRLLSVGAGMLALGFAVPLSSFLPQRLQIRPLLLAITPTASLIEQVSTSQGFLMDEWVELRTRSLSVHEHDRLTLGLLERDSLQLHAWGDDAKWLIAQSAAGLLSDKATAGIVRRFLGPTLRSGVGKTQLWTSDAQAWGLADCFAGRDLWLLADWGSGRGVPVAAPQNLGLAPTVYTNRPGVALTGDQIPAGVNRVWVWVFLVPKGTPAGVVTWSGTTPTMEGQLVAVPIEVSR